MILKAYNRCRKIEEKVNDSSYYDLTFTYGGDDIMLERSMLLWDMKTLIIYTIGYFNNIMLMGVWQHNNTASDVLFF